MRLLASFALTAVSGKSTAGSNTQNDGNDYNGDYGGPPVVIQPRDGWGLFNPFASLLTDTASKKKEKNKKDKKLKFTDYSVDEYDTDDTEYDEEYGVNEYGVADYSYDDYEDDDEYIGELEGFNVTTIQGSQAYEKVQAAIQLAENFDFRGGGFGSINAGPNSPGVQAASAKRMNVIMMMIAYLQADPTEGFDKFFQYGCWCFPEGENSVLGGYGEAQDGADSVCKRYHNCQRCIDKDYVDCPEWAPYRYNGKVDKATGKRTIKCNNKQGTCRRNHCECDKKLAEDLAEYEMLWNPTLSLQFGGFDRHGECPSPHERTNNGNDNEHSCCGVYPDRYPYVSKNSKGDLRKCCLTKTYDPRQLACCQHHELKAVGTCFEPCEANPNGIHCRNGNRP